MRRAAGAEPAVTHMAGRHRAASRTCRIDAASRPAGSARSELPGAVRRAVPIGAVSDAAWRGRLLLAFEFVPPVLQAIVLARINVATQAIAFLANKLPARSEMRPPPGVTMAGMMLWGAMGQGPLPAAAALSLDANQIESADLRRRDRGLVNGGASNSGRLFNRSTPR